MAKNVVASFILIYLFLFLSCEREGATPTDQEKPEVTESFTIQIFSRLNNDQLLNPSGSVEIMDLIRAIKRDITLLHRVDASFNDYTSNNPIVTIGEAVLKIPLFIWNRYSATHMEGSGVLLEKSIREMSNRFILDGCNLFVIPFTQSKGNEMKFAFITFENEEQLAAGSEIVAKYVDDTTLLFGFVGKSLRKELIATFVAKGIHCEIIDGKDGQSSQLLFFLANEKYVIGNQKETAVGTSGISCFDVDIEVK